MTEIIFTWNLLDMIGMGILWSAITVVTIMYVATWFNDKINK